ncbi:helix-turn-helix transcriptional regulator [Amycolatopsis sp. NPDC059021]|uniref:helix-turn-helix transcriptional regulator n=1 Tax=Amycolatopsis sp. NPDC059021 TaxID=3346704 RepID=UPI00366C5F04
MTALVFDSADLARTEAFLSSSYAPMRIGSTTRESHARITRAAAEPVSVDHLDLSFEMSYNVRPLEKICLCDIDSGTVEDHSPAGSAPESFGPGEIFSFAPPDRPYTGRICQARYTITMFDPHLLDEVAATAPGSAGRRVRLLDHRPVTDAAGRQLRHTITHLRKNVLADPASQAHPLVVSTAARYLAARVLATFPNTALTEPTGTDRHDALPATVRRATAYIDSHLDTDISLADIAAAARVTVRALQYAFRRHLGTTPTAYLRRIRLEHAHEDLRRADPARGGTVTAIAMRWGFYHQGHFATAYRRAYGATPSETLHA